jgi:SEC-C motif
MALTLSQEASGRVSGVVLLPPRLGRKELCHCGSGAKYKHCCREGDEVLRREQRGAALPEWIENSRGKLHQFEKYASNVFDLPGLLASLRDKRRRPEISTFDVANSLLHTALLRIPSLNALEGDLKKSDFQMLLGRQPTPEEKAFSAEVVANVLDKFELDSIRDAIDDVIHKAERNKAFRDGYGPLRCVAVDGWEPFSSYQRHCPHCLVRKVEGKQDDGEVQKVEQYYHRYVVALLLGPDLDVVLGIEPVLNEEALRDIDPAHEGHEGELTAGRRLIQWLHQTYGGFIDAIVADALYAVGPVMTEVTEFGYGAFLVLKKENQEPFKEASSSGRWRGLARAARIRSAKSRCNLATPMTSIRSIPSKEKSARSAPWSLKRIKRSTPGASPWSVSARAKSAARWRCGSSGLVGTSRTPAFINGPVIGISRTFFGIRRRR